MIVLITSSFWRTASYLLLRNYFQNTLATSWSELRENKGDCLLVLWAFPFSSGFQLDQRWDGWMASLTQWTWVWVSSRSWWWTWRHAAVHGVAKSRTWLSDWTELNWTDMSLLLMVHGPELRTWPSFRRDWEIEKIFWIFGEQKLSLPFLAPLCHLIYKMIGLNWVILQGPVIAVNI